MIYFSYHCQDGMDFNTSTTSNTSTTFEFTCTWDEVWTPNPRPNPNVTNETLSIGCECKFTGWVDKVSLIFLLLHCICRYPLHLATIKHQSARENLAPSRFPSTCQTGGGFPSEFIFL